MNAPKSRSFRWSRTDFAFEEFIHRTSNLGGNWILSNSSLLELQAHYCCAQTALLSAELYSLGAYFHFETILLIRDRGNLRLASLPDLADFA
jgi:hypothetical protein